MTFFFRRRREAGPKDIRDVFGEGVTFDSLGDAASSISAGSPTPSQETLILDDTLPVLQRDSDERHGSYEVVMPSSAVLSPMENEPTQPPPQLAAIPLLALRRANGEAAEDLQTRKEYYDRVAEEERPAADLARYGKSGRLFSVPSAGRSQESPVHSHLAPPDKTTRPLAATRVSRSGVGWRRATSVGKTGQAGHEVDVSQDENKTATSIVNEENTLSPCYDTLTSRNSATSNVGPVAPEDIDRSKSYTARHRGLSGRIPTGRSGRISSLSGKIPRRPSWWGGGRGKKESRFGLAPNSQDVWSRADETSDVTEEGTDSEETSFSGDGYGRSRRPDGAEYAGQFVKSEMNGVGELRTKEGDIYKGEFAKGVKCGMGMTNYANGDKHVGTYADDLPNGYGSLTYANNHEGIVKYSGFFREGKKDGRGRDASRGGAWEWRGVYSSGEREEGKFYLPNGQVFEELPPACMGAKQT